MWSLLMTWKLGIWTRQNSEKEGRIWGLGTSFSQRGELSFSCWWHPDAPSIYQKRLDILKYHSLFSVCILVLLSPETWNWRSLFSHHNSYILGSSLYYLRTLGDFIICYAIRIKAYLTFSICASYEWVPGNDQAKVKL